MVAIHVVFTAFPGPGNECLFVEVEDSDGKSIRAGEWRARKDGYVELVFEAHAELEAQWVEAQKGWSEAIGKVIAERDEARAQIAAKDALIKSMDAEIVDDGGRLRSGAELIEKLEVQIAAKDAEIKHLKRYVPTKHWPELAVPAAQQAPDELSQIFADLAAKQEPLGAEFADALADRDGLYGGLSRSQEEHAADYVLPNDLAEARAQIAAKDAALLEGKPFGIDPATHFLHADDGGAPDSCVFYVPRDELAEARAQIAAKDAALDTLDEAHQITQQNLWQDIEELRASCASLRETKDTFFRNAEAWEAKYNTAEQEHQDFRLQNDAEWRAKLDHLKAELAEARAQIAAKDAALKAIGKWCVEGFPSMEKLEASLIALKEELDALRSQA